MTTLARLRRRTTAIDRWITLSAVALLIVQVAHHEMWHDEINAFELALHSPTLTVLFHNLHYEGHPALWYVILWIASCVSENPATVQVVHTVIVVSIYLMIGLFSPFSSLEKLLLLSGYFLGFEYAVLARNYSLGVFFALLYAEMRSKRPDMILLNSGLLGLLANTTVFGLLMSGAFACEYVVDLITRARRSGTPPFSKIGLGAAVYVVSIGACIVTIVPATDIGAHGGTWLLQYATKIWHLKLAAVSVVGLSFVPLDGDFPAEYWIGSVPAMQTLWGIREAGFVLVLAALAGIFRNDMRWLLVILATAAAATLFCHLIYLSGIRQTGIFFVAVLTALWMQRVYRKRGSWLVPLLLLCGSVAGIEAQIGQWMRPFSNAGAAARFLIDNGWRDAGLIGVRDDWTIPVAQLLDRPLHGLDCQCSESFIKFDSRHDLWPEQQFAERLTRAVAEVQGSPVLLIYNNPPGLHGDPGLAHAGLRFIPLARFSGAESGENYQIFRIEPAW